MLGVLLLTKAIIAIGNSIAQLSSGNQGFASTLKDTAFGKDMVLAFEDMVKQLRHGIILSGLKLEVNKMKVEKIHHVSIMVKDLEKAGKLYSDLLGMEFSGPHEQKALDVKFLSFPLGINLVTPLTPDGPSARTLERRGEGLSMLILNVSNIEEAIADMESHGVKLVGREERPSSKTATFHPKDLCGVFIELIEE